MPVETMDPPVWRIFKGPFFRLAYPDHWESEIIENIPAFYDPHGCGALQVAASTNPESPYVLETEMVRYLGRHGMELDRERVVRFQTDAGLDCLACEFMKEGRFWLVYMMGEADKLLIVFYNADRIPDAAEVRIISRIIRSITLE